MSHNHIMYNSHPVPITYFKRQAFLLICYPRPPSAPTGIVVGHCVLSAVRLSICPSVNFWNLFAICFEILIWNLAYTFNGWRNMSSLGFIVISSLWPTLQPKVGQTIFCNHGLWNQDKSFKFGICVACSVLFFKNYIFGILAIILSRFGFF